LVGVQLESKLNQTEMHDGLVQLYRKRLKQTSNKKVRPHEGDFVLKMTLSFQPDFRGKWTPSYEGRCAMTLTTMDGDKLTRPTNTGAIKKYFVKIYKYQSNKKNQKAR